MLIYELLFGTYPSVLNIEVSSFQRVGIERFHCIIVMKLKLLPIRRNTSVFAGNIRTLHLQETFSFDVDLRLTTTPSLYLP